MNPILRAVASLLVLAAVCARADLTILQEISSQDNPKSAMVTTTKWKGDKIRLDAGGKVSMIVDGKDGGMVSLMHEQKIAVPLSAAVQKMAGQMAGGAGTDPADPAQFQGTGRTETMIGLACEEFTGTISGQKISTWITKDVPEYKGLAEQLQSIAPQLKQYQSPLSGNPALQGLPVLTEITGQNGKKTTIRVQAISRDGIADSEFKIPDGYRKMEIPQIPGMPTGR
ncbi:MAG: DUF4412 domain-containing protein [Verrucomicrobiota bacterium]